MLTKIKQKLLAGSNKKLISNFVALSILQGANFLLPLITFPYLVRVVGVEKFGLIMFAQAFIIYFSMLADYGFNLSGIREVSIHKNNKVKLVKIYSSIMMARFGLTVIGFILMSIIVFSFEKFSKDWPLYFSTYGMVVGAAMFPAWFFQGMEKMKYVTVLTIIAKAIFTLSIFVFIQSAEDYIYVPILNAMGYIVAGFIALIIIFRDFQIQFKIQKFKLVKIQFIRGWHIFISKISINLYTATNTFLLGIFTNDTTVGYYAIAEKVIRIITSMFAPFFQAIYPHVVQLTKQSKRQAKLFLQQVLKYIVLISFVTWMFFFYYSPLIFNLIFGYVAQETIDTFKLLSPLIIIIPIASIFFNVTMLSYRLDYYFSRIYSFGALLNLTTIGIFFMLVESKILGVTIALVISETVITLMAATVLYRKNILK